MRELWTAGDYERLTGYGNGELDLDGWVKIVHAQDREKLRSFRTSRSAAWPSASTSASSAKTARSSG